MRGCNNLCAFRQLEFLLDCYSVITLEPHYHYCCTTAEFIILLPVLILPPCAQQPSHYAPNTAHLQYAAIGETKPLRVGASRMPLDPWTCGNTWGTLFQVICSSVNTGGYFFSYLAYGRCASMFSVTSPPYQ